MSTPYISCIKIGGVPIIPPLITPQIREECLAYKRKAIEREKKKERNKLYKKCMDDLEKLEDKTKGFVSRSLESQLVFEESSPSPVPYEDDMCRKLRNLTSETIDVSEYSDGGVKVLSGDEVGQTPPPKLIRSNSYTLESPSPILLAHLEKEARKCVELNESESQSMSPVTVIDSEPPLQVQDTDISIQEVVITTPLKSKDLNQNQKIDPRLLDILEKLPEEHARNIIDILNKQEENHRTIREQIEEDKSFGVSISSQSLYYSTLSPDTTRESPQLNLINLKNFKNKELSEHEAASIIQAHVRGYLTRRLIRTERVQGLIETIKEVLLCALKVEDSEVIDEADVELHRRLIQQISAACYAFHDVFFTMSINEQMSIISVDRQRKIEKAKRPLSATSSNLSLSARRSARTIR